MINALTEPALLRRPLPPDGAGVDVAAPGLRRSCSVCMLTTERLPCAPRSAQDAHWEPVVCVHGRLAAGSLLYRQGDPFRFIYTVRSGTLKSIMTLPDGRSQISGFHMAGQVMALDGAASTVQVSTAEALEDSHVCTIDYAALMGDPGQDPAVQRRVARLMSQEILRGQRNLLSLGLLNAQERVGAFLLDLSRQFSVRGYSAHDFNLRMTRAEIGSHLGMTLETVSRTLTAFQQRGLLRVDNRRVHFHDLEGFTRQYGVLQPA